MNRLLTLIFAACLLGFVACSNGAKEKKEKASQDSLRTLVDSLKKVLKERVKADSLAQAKKKADSIANAKKKPQVLYDDCGN